MKIGIKIFAAVNLNYGKDKEKEEKIMKKKILSVLLASVMTVSVLAGCGSEAGTASGTGNGDGGAAATEAGSGASNDGQTYNIGICQLVEHPALDAATQGFKDALTEKLGDNVKFDEQNAQGEQPNAVTICNGFVSDNVDLILANATSPLQAAAAATTTIPVLGTSITDYATALEISDWSGSTGRNISGTSDLAPIDEQEKILLELYPSPKQVGLLYCSAEANSLYQIELFEKALSADGVTSKRYSIADTNEIQAVVSTAASECDVLYIPTDNTLANAAESVYSITGPAKVPVICGEEGICAGCGVATLSISYYDLGYKTGEMAYDILVNGADVSTMAVAYAPQVTKEYNKKIADELGITVPSDYVAIGE